MPPPLNLTVAATFTAEPVEPTLRFWLAELGFEGDVAFAPYNQVLPQLLDPRSDIGRNAGGVNLALIRFEDWARFRPDGVSEEVVLREGVDELIAAARDYASRAPAPLAITLCPPSDLVAEDRSRLALHRAEADRLSDGLAGLASVRPLDLLNLDAPYDPRGDAIGHMPYTPLGYAALGSALARRVHAIKAPRPKVVALDCDNTLWKGVVGEDGPHGVTFPPGLRALQEFVVGLQEAGLVVCLLSKNVEEDVFAVFDARRDEMALKREHLVTSRINWRPKSENIAELAVELNLGLDSFVFLDDNPVECAEMRSSRPEVLTLQVPAEDDEVAGFLRHVWALDILSVTEEDRRRTALYRENAERGRFESQTGGIEAFLAGLGLTIDIDRPGPDEITRVAQLTQKTNQFNVTTIRRDESEIARLGDSGLECLRVKVTDRFGDYGLVGVVIYGERGDALEVDSLLLSCRVLGRGVEHAMLAKVGAEAVARGKARVDVRFVPTAKNRPASNFLESVGSEYRAEAEGGSVYRFPASVAAASAYSPGSDAADQLELARERPKVNDNALPARDRSASYTRIATELRDPSAVLAALTRGSTATRPSLDTPYEGPRTALERDLSEIWAVLLGLDRVGVFDDFNALGGTSLKAARLFIEIDERFGRKLPMTTILDAPTVAQLAPIVAGHDANGPRPTLRLLREGVAGGPALFLVHDGDGETLLYLNLARRLPAEVAVYGLEPLSLPGVAMAHTRIGDMAAHYLVEVRKVQPEGPYLLGGMCAGGTIAFEMGLRLEAAGDSVGLVALLDPAAPLAVARAGREAEDRRERLRQALAADRAGPTGWKRHVARVAKLLKKAKGFATYQVMRRVRAVSVSVRFRALRKATDHGRPVPAWGRGLIVRRVYERAEAEYVPARKLDAPAYLFRATEGVGNDAPFRLVYEDPLLGWGQWVNGPIELCETPGGHSSMLQEPHVAAMAERFRACLDDRVGVTSLGEGGRWTS